MDKIKIRINPLFLFFACLLLFFGQAFLLLNYIVVMFLHEYSHAFVAKCLGYEIKDISVLPFGICLNMKSQNLLPNDEFKIAIAGPLMNLFLAILCIALWWVFPVTYNYTSIFCFTNLVTCFFNLVPVFPLDGGRVFLCWCSESFGRKKAVKVCKIFNIVIAIILLLLFIFSLFFGVNLTFLFMSIFVFSGAFSGENKQEYNYLCLNYKLKFKHKSCKVRTVALRVDLQVFRLVKFVNNNCLTEFFVVDFNKKILFRFSEFDLEKIFKNNSPTALLGDLSFE